jgi:hypothetical protein
MSDAETHAQHGYDPEPLSPELVLVSPGLRAEACRRLSAPSSAELAPPDSTPRAPEPVSALKTLAGTVEVTARVPVLLLVCLCLAIVVARMTVMIGTPVVIAVTLGTLLGS